jgi:hypothetical protein
VTKRWKKCLMTCRSRRWTLALAVGGWFLASEGGGLRAQEDAGASVSTAAPNFLFTRYGTRNASVLYAGFGLGRVGMFFGIVDNPRSGYEELIAGVNTQWSRSTPGASRSLLLGLAATRASDGDYAQIYIIPSYGRGRFSATGTLELYQPIDGAFGGAFEEGGVQQAELNPLQIFWRLDERWSVGTAYVLSISEGAQPKDRGGPAVQVAVPRGTVTVEYLAGLRRAKDELRISLQVGF